MVKQMDRELSQLYRCAAESLLLAQLLTGRLSFSGVREALGVI